LSGAEPLDPRRCLLGEGPLWHPDRGELLWFDIPEGRLLAAGGDEPREWALGEMASAAALTPDPDRLLIATETALILYDLAREAREEVAPLDAERPETRSNDGRADPWGGFWIGTMGKGGEAGLGAIHRWRAGELRTLHPGIDVPNAICFDRDRSLAFFADTAAQVVMRQPVHPETGWPEGEAVTHIDLSGEGLNPDGAVIDAEGALWVAQWGAGRVARHSPEGRFLGAVEVPGLHSSCPAFGGQGLATLYCTTARQGLTEAQDRDEAQGRTYALPGAGRGRPEPRIEP
jgi:sugar lactone lactonase YvrE